GSKISWRVVRATAMVSAQSKTPTRESGRFGCLGGLGRNRTTDTRIFNGKPEYLWSKAKRKLQLKQALGRVETQSSAA
ncbi:hypothetical protein, partial [Aquabacterium sp.]|uniref:hypothetical protein n=1 Tax=Aquabacterium sp. TaxID=1872578 RepID=UPI0035C6FDFD